MIPLNKKMKYRPTGRYLKYITKAKKVQGGGVEISSFKEGNQNSPA